MVVGSWFGLVLLPVLLAIVPPPRSGLRKAPAGGSLHIPRQKVEGVRRSGGEGSSEGGRGGVGVMRGTCRGMGGGRIWRLGLRCKIRWGERDGKRGGERRRWKEGLKDRAWENERCIEHAQSTPQVTARAVALAFPPRCGT